MPYTAPTAEDFAARFPALSATAEETVDYWLADAATSCADFPEELRARAELNLAAHCIVQLSSEPSLAVQGVRSFKSADFALELGNASDRTGLMSTIYGQEFKRLTRVAFAGPRMAW